MMVLMMVLHLTGGFKKPRELTWVTGVILAVVTVSFGVTGYSLPWDQAGFWACKIVTGVPAAVPLVGPPSLLHVRDSLKFTSKVLPYINVSIDIGLNSVP
mmetsp:Transcript_9981/g.13178  ORF Transcript_9981/g.13178 Transcript_9981/m.13178 type:complete len:100 (+) Transcript_9981:70-369(+)